MPGRRSGVPATRFYLVGEPIQTSGRAAGPSADPQGSGGAHIVSVARQAHGVGQLENTTEPDLEGELHECVLTRIV
jgi:hypothetical protein